MTVTNNERRAVAARLRKYRASVTPHSLTDYIFDDPWRHNCCEDVANRLADLIEPDRDLTCELEPTASERTDAPVRVYECDHCGKSCDSVWAEDYVYCPYCGRLNTAREVEVEE